MRTAVCAIVKNEHRYLKEWIQYYLDIGFTDIYVGEDYDSNSHEEIVNKFDSNKVHLIQVEDFVPTEKNIRNGAKQIEYYNVFFQRNKDKYDWIAFFDIDEFLVLEKESLREFLNDYKDYEGVSLTWKYYGANGHIKAPVGGVRENYTKPINIEIIDCQVKTIVNCHKAEEIIFQHACTHNCVTVLKEFAFKKSLNGFGMAIEKYWNRAWINHYFTRSWEEWVERMVRGNMQNNYRTLDTFFIYNPDMIHLQETLTLEAAKLANSFSNTRIYSRKYSLYNKNYVKELKNKFLEKLNINNSRL